MSSNFNTDLKKAKRLGPAHHGAKHWLHQRLSAVVITVLIIRLLFFAKQIAHSSFSEVIFLIKQPLNLVPCALFVLSSFYHGLLGLQVIIEDYISNIFIRNFIIFLSQAFVVLTFILAFIALFYIR